MQAIQSPLPFFTDLDGSPLSFGSLFIGTENANPETSPVAAFWDFAGTQPVAQPVQILGGVPVRNGTPAVIYITAAVSLTWRNRKGVIVAYMPSTAPLTVGFVNPMTTIGDMIRAGTAGAAQRLAAGTNGQVLTMNSGLPTWQTPAAGFANPMTAAGDLIRGTGLGVAQRLAVGTNGQVLTVAAGLPVWQTPASVTLPTYFGFSAQRITSDVIAAGTVLFNDIASTGAYVDSVAGTPVYDPATGKFTAPQSRDYQINAALLFHNATGGAVTINGRLKINGSVVQTIGPSTDIGISSTVVFNRSLRLVQSDVVEIDAPNLSASILLKVGSSFSVRAL